MWAFEETGYGARGKISQRKRNLIKCVYDRGKDTACEAVRGDRRVYYDPLANETGKTPPPALPEKEKTREISDFCT